ncbi:tRNA pseudouridine(38-40) synthase TruA, partial [Enterococcus faecalis]
HDFIGFSALKKNKKSTTRTIEKITIERNGEMLQFTFVSNGFLHKMVRILVGTLLEIGAATKELAKIDEMFATKVREG